MCKGLCGMAVLSGIFVTALAGALGYKLLKRRETGKASAGRISEVLGSAVNGFKEGYRSAVERPLEDMA